MKKLLLSLIALVILGNFSHAQETFPRNDAADERPSAFAFTNATIHVDHQKQLTQATLLVKDGKVVQVGNNVTIPKGYQVVDLKGKTVYPGFIDIYSNYGMPEVTRGSGGFGARSTIGPGNPSAYNANDAIKSQYDAFEEFKTDEKTAKKLRDVGFGAVMTFKADGIARGSSTFVTLGEGRSNEVMLAPKAAAMYSFDKGSSRQAYPSSLIGSISLLRQTYLDASWYKSLKDKPFADNSLDAWNANQSLPQIFEANSWINALRADKIGDEFGVQYIIKGGGDDYQRAQALKQSNATIVVPLNYPAAYDVEDPLDAYNVTLAQMKHWELAPANLAHLEKNGVPFAITAAGLQNPSDFLKNLRKAHHYGLSKTAALKGLTTTPAQLLNMGDKVGHLNPGAVANFFIADGDIFEEKTQIHENWIQGKGYMVKGTAPADLSGKYTLSFNGETHALEISGEPGKQQAKIVAGEASIEVSLKVDGAVVGMHFSKTKDGEKITLTGWQQGNNLSGTGRLEDGTFVSWNAAYTAAAEAAAAKPAAATAEAPQTGEVIYPFVSYGSAQKPQQETILFKNATVWTMEAEGVLTNTDVLIQNGKIQKIGKNLSANGARVIDATGKHLTPGIIDEHSHIGGAAINEGGVNNSSMVRMYDVVDSEDQEIYRALSGGVTAIQLLHGSANPVGGQSALLKLRWGATPDELPIQGADGFIKFALGENVKRQRNSDPVRYPRTRMGVEQVYVDGFTNAQAYEQEWKRYNSLSAAEKANTPAPRRDLVMDAMVEILNSKRFITCHSYVQSEINMFMKVAERFNFRVNTFTHILEGYKVADIMAEHGVGGSTFSDWWSYKWEVRYAIPYGSTLMSREGVLTAVNSDNAELMRRLNQEAAKAVKYGGLDEYDAMKMATINPAKLLHLDDRMGSIKVGKDGDVVLWSDHPLSIYARAEKTVVDGTVYFDVEKDQEMKLAIEKERARLIQKMLGEKAGGASMQRPTGRMRPRFDCEDEFTYTGSNY